MCALFHYSCFFFVAQYENVTDKNGGRQCKESIMQLTLTKSSKRERWMPECQPENQAQAPKALQKKKKIDKIAKRNQRKLVHKSRSIFDFFRAFHSHNLLLLDLKP